MYISRAKVAAKYLELAASITCLLELENQTTYRGEKLLFSASGLCLNVATVDCIFIIIMLFIHNVYCIIRYIVNNMEGLYLLFNIYDFCKD